MTFFLSPCSFSFFALATVISVVYFYIQLKLHNYFEQANINISYNISHLCYQHTNYISITVALANNYADILLTLRTFNCKLVLLVFYLIACLDLESMLYSLNAVPIVSSKYLSY